MSADYQMTPGMMNPAKLAAGDTNSRHCPYCPITTQGGRDGLRGFRPP